jgi:hypothetical protein
MGVGDAFVVDAESMPPAGEEIGVDAVRPLAASAFDLPDHLAAKADPAVIAADDEKHVAATADSL